MRNEYRLIDKDTIEKTTVSTISLKDMREMLATLRAELANLEDVPEIPTKREYIRKWEVTGLSHRQVEEVLTLLRDLQPRDNIEARIDAMEANIARLLMKCKDG